MISTASSRIYRLYTLQSSLMWVLWITTLFLHRRYLAVHSQYKVLHFVIPKISNPRCQTTHKLNTKNIANLWKINSFLIITSSQSSFGEIFTMMKKRASSVKQVRAGYQGVLYTGFLNHSTRLWLSRLVKSEKNLSQCWQDWVSFWRKKNSR